MIRKLSAAETLNDRDHAVLTEMCGRPRYIEAGQDIIRAGDPPSDVHLVLDGFAYRYKILSEGNRQIVAVLLPGDFCDLHVAILGEMDHAIATLSPCTIVDIPAATIRYLTENHPRITRALWWATLVDEGILREWLSSMGQREAPERLAHLICELLLRLRLVGIADEGGYDLPLSQIDLADILGMTSVHVNRTLRHLRQLDLVDLKRRRLTISDVARLKTYCSFDPAYLHLRPSRPADRR
ncbi:Crp/Fnr family transcriptional regulator [Methylobacterium sp. NMS12]|uniref:Crp/Fnr family transcriptional regulator n=1 Tax=Methylobacterium sp. NMS12 TaxID=3079766 RepID=UPI003F883564